MEALKPMFFSSKYSCGNAGPSLHAWDNAEQLNNLQCKISSYQLQTMEVLHFAIPQASKCKSCKDMSYKPDLQNGNPGSVCRERKWIKEIEEAAYFGNVAGADALMVVGIKDGVPEKELAKAKGDGLHRRLTAVQTNIRTSFFSGYASLNGRGYTLRLSKMQNRTSIYEQSMKRAMSEQRPHAWFSLFFVPMRDIDTDSNSIPDYFKYHWISGVTPRSEALQVEFDGEHGIDAGGLSKDWLRLSMESIVRPRPELDADADLGVLAGTSEARAPRERFTSRVSKSLRILKGEEDEALKVPHFLLEAMDKYDIPVWSSISRSLHPAGVLPQEALVRYRFLGQFLARAFVVESIGFSPRRLHPFIYDSIAQGRVIKPAVTESPYAEEYQIEVCEWLVQLRGRGIADVHTYGSMPDDPFRPMYASESWDLFAPVWGVDVPIDKEEDIAPTDDVSAEDARAYTTMVCNRLWRDRFEAPVAAMMDGFYAVVPWSKINAPSSGVGPMTGGELQFLVEGSAGELDVETLLGAVEWRGAWSQHAKSLMIKAVKGLSTEELKNFVAFFTGSSREPVGGWKGRNAPKFSLLNRPLEKGHCRLFKAHTCFNMLDVPDGCLNDKKIDQFVEKLKLSIPNTDYGFA
jgi:hypothetical protein